MKNSRADGLIIDQEGREVPAAEVLRAPGFGDRAGASPFGESTFQAYSFGFNATPLTHEQRLARLEAVAKLMDVAFVMPGTNIRYGIDGLIGLIPVVGDVVTTAIALWIVSEARALGAPWHLTARMLSNVAVDGVIGIVPVVGDAFDVMFRANARNVRMLRRWLDKKSR